MFCNPIIYLIDWDKAETNETLELKYKLPYSDVQSLSKQSKQKYEQEHIPFEFGHTLTDQIRGKIDAGFAIKGFYEDKGQEALDKYTDSFIATQAIKL